MSPTKEAMEGAGDTRFRRRRTGGAPPPCPRAGHEGSEVSLDGFYGKPGHRRQQYRCRPCNGDPAHRFTEPLPRQQARRPLGGRGDGATPTPRLYEFSVADIARALVAVGRGMSYREAAFETRRRAHRFPTGAGGGPISTRHGQLVADWVEVFAPVVFERHRARSEREYTAVLEGDEVLLLHRMRFVGQRRRSSRASLLEALSPAGPADGDCRLHGLAPGGSGADGEDWERLLGGLPGSAPRVLCGHDRHAVAAVHNAWPDAEVATERWIDPDERKRPRPRGGRSDHVLSAAALDRSEDLLRERLGRRALRLRNRQRLERLLLLVLLDVNDLAGEAGYATAIGAWLAEHGGRPDLPRRAVSERE